MTTQPPAGLQQPPTLAEEIYRFLEGEILSGRIEGGTRLVLRQIAEQVGTSIIPVRDAINRLEDVGLAVSEPRKGAVVKAYSTAELIDIYELRLLIEAEATRLATPHVTGEALSGMEEALHEIAELIADERMGDATLAEAALYRTLYGFSGNTALNAVIEQLWKQSHLYRITAHLEDAEQTLYEVTEHTVEAVKSRDPDAAARSRRRGIQRSLDNLTARERG